MPEYTPFRSGELCKTIKLFGECNEREKTLLTSLLKKDCERKMFILQPWRIKTTKLTAQVWKIATQTFLLWWVIFMYFHFDRLSGRSYGSIRGAYTYFLPRAHRAARYTFLFFFPTIRNHSTSLTRCLLGAVAFASFDGFVVFVFFLSFPHFYVFSFFVFCWKLRKTFCFDMEINSRRTAICESCKWKNRECSMGKLWKMLN